MITEDRLSPDEVFRDYEVSDYTFPTREQVRALKQRALEADERALLGPRRRKAIWKNPLTKNSCSAMKVRLLLASVL